MPFADQNLPQGAASDVSHALVEGITQHAIFMMDAKGGILNWNPGVGHILGYSREEWIGQSASLIFTPEDRAAGLPEREMHRARVEGHAEDIRWHVKKDGTRFYADGFLTPVYDATGDLIGYGKVLRDATDRKRNEDRLLASIEALRVSSESLRASEERFSAVILTAMEGILIAGENQKIVSCNPAALEMFGYQEEADVIGAPLEVLMPQRFRAAHGGHVRGFGASGLTRRTKESFGVLYARRRDGTEFPIEASVSRFTDSEGHTLFAAFIRDIAERIRAEETLRETTEWLRDALAREHARAEREALLNQIADGVRQSLPPEEIEVLAITVLGKALSADRCYLFTTDVAHDSLVVAQDWHAEGLPSLVGQYRLSDFGIDVDATFGSGETLVLSDIQSTGRLSDENVVINHKFQVASVINVPFYDEGQFVGALGIAMAHTAREWTAEEVALAETVAGQLRSVVEVARLQQREHTIAEQLQEALQPPPPRSLPTLNLASYYRPALDEAGVGGDGFDVFPVTPGCTALTVFDLAGKGIAAASQVATVRNMLRYALHTSPTLADALTTLNRVLVEQDLLTGFATLFIGFYDESDRTLTYANCGQEPGLLWRAETGGVEQLTATGPVLGAFLGESFHQVTVQLAPEDVLVLFTDGMTEVGRTRKGFLEIKGLMLLLAQCCAEARAEASLDAESIKGRLIGAVETYAGGAAGLRDDIALLVGVVKGDLTTGKESEQRDAMMGIDRPGGAGKWGIV